MDTIRFFDKINRLFKDRIQRIDEEVLTGSPKDLETYKSLVAARRELIAAQDEIKSMFNRAHNEEDDD